MHPGVEQDRAPRVTHEPRRHRKLDRFVTAPSLEHVATSGERAAVEPGDGDGHTDIMVGATHPPGRLAAHGRVLMVADRRCGGDQRRRIILATMGDMIRRLPFPFPGGRFPADLGAVVHRTVLAGDQPARIVVHTSEGDWLVADGINDPNEPGASVATHLAHVIERNASIADLATLEPGQVAERSEPGQPWSISVHDWSPP